MTELALDLDAIVDTHLAAYAEPDPPTRTLLIERVWSEGGVLIDPPFEGRGRAEISALTDTVLEHYPDHTFARTTAVDEHHGFARYGWALVAPDGTPAVTGTDFVQLDETGRIARILGFFGDPAPRNG
jgi:hypothetical protein